MDQFSEPPKLSLVAQFDDMCRFANSFVSIEEESLKQLILNAEENRIKWLLTQREMDSMRAQMKKLEEDNNTLQANLQRVRFSFGKEVQNREDLIKQRNALKNQLNAIKEFVLDDPLTQQSIETRDKVLSYLNLNRLETLNEVSKSDDSLSGVEYDKTEDEILDQSRRRSGRLSASKRRVSTNANECDQNAKRMSPGLQTVQNTVPMATEEVFEDNIEMDFEGKGRNECYGEPYGRKVDKNVNSNTITSTPFKPFSSMSSPYMRTPNKQLFRNIISTQELSPMSRKNLLEDRKHNLHQKKAFKPLYCGPCGKAIGFCGTCYVCGDCQVISHIKCKDQLPLPCIPFSKPNGKTSRMLLIADFAPQTRPMIPALIIHCCNEIEKRGIEEEGIYRKSGSNKEVRELKDKISNSKTGMPSLVQYDVHVLCGVVKLFLHQLDEAIVTRILWRDFVRAADQENPDEESVLIMRTVAELPTSNRDTLAFLMSHLQRIAQNKHNLMETKALAKIFGPTIVGYSMIDPPMTELLAENPKQVKVMEALFRIPEDYWNSIISDNDFNQQSKYGSPDRRQSVGTRLFGNVVSKGTLTPQRTGFVQRRGSLTLKPLF